MGRKPREPKPTELAGNILDAIEAFVLARIAQDKAISVGDRNARRKDVDETRQHLRDQLTVLIGR
jgi:hypothetical protein